MAADKNLWPGSAAVLVLKLLEEKQREWSVYAGAVNRILRGGVSYGAV